MRLAFFGLPLAALLLGADGLSPAFAVLSPVAAPGRRRLLRAARYPVLDASSLAPEELDARVSAALLAEPPDLIASWYWTRRLPEAWLRAARFGAIGAHPSLLPRHRGPNPFFGAIDSGDERTGVSIHRLTARYDEGDVLFTESLPVGERDAWQLARALDRPSLRLFRRAVRAASEGALPPGEPQDEALATWAPEPEGELARVDFRWETARVLRRIRALSPVPGVALSIRGVDLVATTASAAAEFPLALAPGEAASAAGGVVIRTADGAVRLERGILAAADDEDEGELPSFDAEALARAVFG